jgi:hypothetical protein
MTIAGPHRERSAQAAADCTHVAERSVGVLVHMYRGFVLMNCQR